MSEDQFAYVLKTDPVTGETVLNANGKPEKVPLGTGASASVFKGVMKGTNREVAIKVVNEKKLSPLAFDRVGQEDAQLSRLHHRNIAGYIKSQKITNKDGLRKLFIITELCNDGDLMHFVESCPDGKLPLDQFIDLQKQLGDAFGYLRSQNVVHRDIKPQNICRHIEEDGSVTWKLIDFGFSRVLADNELSQSFCGTALYAPPELFRGIAYGPKAEIWSIAVVLYQVLLGVPPFEAQGVQELRESILNFELAKAGPEGMMQVLQESNLAGHPAQFAVAYMLCGMLQEDPTKRWDFPRFLEMTEALTRPVRVFNLLDGKDYIKYPFRLPGARAPPACTTQALKLHIANEITLENSETDTDDMDDDERLDPMNQVLIAYREGRYQFLMSNEQVPSMDEGDVFLLYARRVEDQFEKVGLDLSSSPDQPLPADHLQAARDNLKTVAWQNEGYNAFWKLLKNLNPRMKEIQKTLERLIIRFSIALGDDTLLERDAPPASEPQVVEVHPKITMMEATLEKLSNFNASVQCEKVSDDEFRTLAEEMNDMFGKLEAETSLLSSKDDLETQTLRYKVENHYNDLLRIHRKLMDRLHETTAPHVHQISLFQKYIAEAQEWLDDVEINDKIREGQRPVTTEVIVKDETAAEENKTLRLKVGDLEGKLTFATRQWNDSKDQLALVQQQNKALELTLKNDSARMKAAIADLQAENAALKQQTAALSSQVETQSGSYEQSISELEAAKQEIQELQVQLNKTTREAAQATEDLARVQEEAEAKVSKAEKKLGKLQGMAREVGDLRDQVAAFPKPDDIVPQVNYVCVNIHGSGPYWLRVQPEERLEQIRDKVIEHMGASSATLSGRGPASNVKNDTSVRNLLLTYECRFAVLDCEFSP
eukprot:m.84163 g.84163  ORF g.84163 m.84163 type:complete len:882 (-) comp21176_c0_seq1:58-2703(-)